MFVVSIGPSLIDLPRKVISRIRAFQRYCIWIHICPTNISLRRVDHCAGMIRSEGEPSYTKYEVIVLYKTRNTFRAIDIVINKFMVPSGSRLNQIKQLQETLHCNYEQKTGANSDVQQFFTPLHDD